MASRAISTINALIQLGFFVALVTQFWGGEWHHASTMDFVSFYAITFGGVAKVFIYALFRNYTFLLDLSLHAVKILICITCATSIFDSASQLSMDYRVTLSLRVLPYFFTRRFNRAVKVILAIVFLSPCIVFYALTECCLRRQIRQQTEHLILDPVQVYSVNDEPINCFCMEEVRDGDVIQALPCKHKFHLQCIRTWMHHSPTCPVCRYDLLTPPQHAEETLENLEAQSI